MFKYCIIGVSHPHVIALHNSLVAAKAECLGYADPAGQDYQDADKKIHEFLGKAADSLKRYDDFHELLAMKPNLAVVCAGNSSCAKLALEILESGINVALEKPMTTSYADAEALCNAAKKNNVKLITNWPIAWFPAFIKAKELCDSGRIGRVMRVKYLSPATWGPYSYSSDGQNPPLDELKKTWWYNSDLGGGSIFDYACYGSMLSTWIFGHRAKSVKAIAKNFCLPGLDVEDFSAAMLDFGNGIGLLEGSWSTYNCGQIPSGPVIHGTEGTIVCDRHSTLCKLYTGRSHTPIAPTEVFDCKNSIDGYNFGENVIAYINGTGELNPMLQPELNADVMFALDAIKSQCKL